MFFSKSLSYIFWIHKKKQFSKKYVPYELPQDRIRLVSKGMQKRRCRHPLTTRLQPVLSTSEECRSLQNKKKSKNQCNFQWISTELIKYQKTYLESIYSTRHLIKQRCEKHHKNVEHLKLGRKNNKYIDRCLKSKARKSNFGTSR